MKRDQLFAILTIVIVVVGTGVYLVLIQPTLPPVNVLTHEVTGLPDHLDPHVSYTSGGSVVAYNVYETLYTYPFGTEDTIPSTPLLAAEPAIVSADGLNYTIELRTGITFHDNTPFNASCVKWNIERAMKIFYLDGPVWMLAEPLNGGVSVEAAAFTYGPTSPEFKVAFQNWVDTSNAIEIIDDYTIRFVLSEPYPPFIPALTFSVGSIMSPSYCITHASNSSWASWTAYGVDFGESNSWMDTHVCGTGPYMLAELVPDQFVQFVRNDNYWRADATDPEIAPSSYAGSIEEVYIRVNSDVYGRILNLRIGETDSCFWPTTNAYEIWDSTNEKSLDPNLCVSTGGLTFVIQFFGFNMGTINSTEGVILTSPFRFKNFRRAASFAFNYDQFVDEAVYGFGIQGKGPVPQGMVGHNGSMYNFQHNITAAVEEWNLAMRDSNFVRALNEMDNHIALYCFSAYAESEYGMVLLADGLTNMLNHPDANLTGLNHNLEFTVHPRAWSAYIIDLVNGRMPIFFLGWAPDYPDPDNYIFPFCYQYGSYAQRIGYNNTEVNTWYEAAKTETNPIERQIYFDQIQEAVAEDVPYLWACQSSEFSVRRAWLKGDGLVFNAMHGVYFYEVYKDYY